MKKAYTKALEVYPIVMSYNEMHMEDEDINLDLRLGFEEGYETAINDMRSMNINNSIWVEINEFGWKHMEAFFKKSLMREDVEEFIKLFKDRTKEYNIDGNKVLLTEMQLHELMNIFGELAYCGGEQFIVDNKIYLSVDF